MTPRKRRRARYCPICQHKTFPSSEDPGRCGVRGCFYHYPERTSTRVLPFPTLRVVRRVDDDDSPPEAA